MNEITNANSKKIILMGAGASAPAGIPTAKSMFEKIYEAIDQEAHYKKILAPTINLAIAGIKFHHSTVFQDPFHEVDIEELYETLITLHNRTNDPLSPFVGSWSSEVLSVSNIQLDDQVDYLTHTLKESLETSLNNSSRDGARRAADINLIGFKRALKDTLNSINGKPSGVFKDAASFLLFKLNSLVWVTDDSKVEYITPLIASSHSKPIWIASLNYDNVIELACEKAGIHCDVGIENDKNGLKFKPDSPVSLAKLHGSVNWLIGDDLRVEIQKEPINSAAVIFGAGNKLKASGPYLDLLLAFRDELNGSDELEIFGYSFRDAHINHIILTWFSQNQNSKIHVIDKYLTENQILKNLNSALEHPQSIYRPAISGRIHLENLGIQEWIEREYA